MTTVTVHQQQQTAQPLGANTTTEADRASASSSALELRSRPQQQQAQAQSQHQSQAQAQAQFHQSQAQFHQSHQSRQSHQPQSGAAADMATVAPPQQQQQLDPRDPAQSSANQHHAVSHPGTTSHPTMMPPVRTLDANRGARPAVAVADDVAVAADRAPASSISGPPAASAASSSSPSRRITNADIHHQHPHHSHNHHNPDQLLQGDDDDAGPGPGPDQLTDRRPAAAHGQQPLHAVAAASSSSASASSSPPHRDGPQDPDTSEHHQPDRAGPLTRTGPRDRRPEDANGTGPGPGPGPTTTTTRDHRPHHHLIMPASSSRPTKPLFLRSKSDRGTATRHNHNHNHNHNHGDDDDDDRHDDDDRDSDLSDEERARWGMRHGFEDHYQSEDIIIRLAKGWYMYYADDRHETTGKPRKPKFQIQDWRMRDRLKTVSAALTVCLNIGVEPPDQLKTNPGAKLEAWTDPAQHKALETIGKSLQAQYENLSIRTRYKQYLDPSVEETKKFCLSLRRSAKDERILFHYNGHGVPKPTASGEIWVFNKTYTQYIPVSLYDLQNWLQAPTIFVWDCSEAGNILANYHRFVHKHEAEEEDTARDDPTYDPVRFRPYIHLAACSVRENLPTNPRVPADMFTACLTTPIEMALWFFVLQNPLRTDLTPERARKLPGRMQERRTPIGELMWILTAITDTIAWTTLPRDMFRRYFRQDLMVAGLFRNFLLAQRIMAVYGCRPQSHPALPDTHQHPQWESWDLAVDLALAQLPMLERKEADDSFEYEYQHSSYFAEQLTAFDVYLTRGDAMARKPPEQLPVVLQVLLSQQHRVRALVLLGKFLDLGPWAVQLALSIGIFPYVVKLLQSNALELKAVMVFIWTRIVAVDVSCQADLIKDSGYAYFAQILRPAEGLPVVDAFEHKAMCAFILAMLCRGYRPGQVVCNQTEIMTDCLEHLRNQANPLLRQWACLCLAQLWRDLPEAKWRGLRESAPARLAELIRDACCEVRAAALHAITAFLGIPDLTDEVARMEESLAWTVLDMSNDGSPMVRREFVVFMSHFVVRFENKFVVAAFEELREEADLCRHAGGAPGPASDSVASFATAATAATAVSMSFSSSESLSSSSAPPPGLAHDTIFAACWKRTLVLNVDPHPEVQRDAAAVADHVHRAVLASAVGPRAQVLMDEIRRRTNTATTTAAAAAANATAATTTNNTKRSSWSSAGLSSASRPAAAQGAGAPPAAPPGILKRTASLLFTLPFLGGEDRSRPSTPPSSAASAASVHTFPRTPAGPQRGRMSSGASSLATTSAPPEHNGRGRGRNPVDYNAAREPVSGGYEDGRDPLVPIPLPLRSTFFDWSVEYFREQPQMTPSESDEPGSTEYNERLWRRSRNEAVFRETQPMKQFAGSHRWNNQLGLLNNGAQPARITFHQFEDHLAVADEGNTITVWDWHRRVRLSRFSNGNPEHSAVSDMRFINEDDQALLLAGSSDGVIRIYRQYDSAGAVELASAWRALTHLVPSNVNSGMVLDWQQVVGRVLVGGDVRVIRLWNASSESCAADIPARSGSCVTSLSSDQMTGNLFVAGFGDGAVRVFDTRNRPSEAMVCRWKDEADRQWVKSVHMQRGGQRELMSASRNGKVRLWDIRMDKPLHVFQTTRETLRTATMHEHLPVFAVGTSNHEVKVFNLEGQELSRAEPYANFLNPGRGAPISTTAFHPHRPILGCAARGDHHINLFTCDRIDQSMFGLG